MSGDLGGRRGVAAAATGDLDLCARDVELWRAAGVVDTELLDTEEVLSSRDLGGDGDRIGGCHYVKKGFREYVDAHLTYCSNPTRPVHWRSRDQSP